MQLCNRLHKCIIFFDTKKNTLILYEIKTKILINIHAYYSIPCINCKKQKNYHEKCNR